MDSFLKSSCYTLKPRRKLNFCLEKNVVNKRVFYNGTHYRNNANYCSAYK